MQKKSGNYERTFLTLSSLLAVGLGGYLVWESQGLADSLVSMPVVPKAEFTPPSLETVQRAQKVLEEKFSWQAPSLKGKQVPLNKSVILLQKGDELFDLQVAQPQLRPPMTNEFILKYRLPNFESPNVGQLDPDADGFTNEEEFVAKTHPLEKESHPPLTQKLVVKQRIVNDYIVKLNTTAAPYQVQKVKPEPRSSKFVQLQDEFAFEKGGKARFKVLEFASKTAKDPKTGADVDASELKLRDLENGREVNLIKSKEVNLATYEVEFELKIGEGQIIKAADQGLFQIPGMDGQFKVLSIGESEAKIVPVKGKDPSGAEILVPKQ